MSYVLLSEHDLDQSPGHSIIAKRQGYNYCRIHPEIKNAHLESTEHHIKYKDREAHKSEVS